MSVEKVVFIPDESRQEGYRVMKNDLDSLGVDINGASFSVFRSSKFKEYVAIPTGVDEIYALSPVSPAKPLEKQLKRKYESAVKIAEGSYGNVWDLPVENLVVKKSKFVGGEIPKDILKEIAIYRLFNKTDFLPNLYDFSLGTCREGSSLMLEKGVTTFRNRAFCSVEDAKKAVLRIVYCLSQIKDQGIIHCDLKPDNILLSEEGTIQIIDWGIAEVDYTQAMNRMKCTTKQTRWYRAPELFLGKEADMYSHKIDIFSLGLIFAELIMEFYLRGKDDNRQCKLYTKFFSDGKEIPKSIEYYVEAKDEEIRANIIRNIVAKTKANIDLTLLDLISKMLLPNPNLRIDYEGILTHPYITALNAEFDRLPVFSCSMPLIEDINQYWIDYDRTKIFLKMLDIAKKEQCSRNVICLAWQILDFYVIRKVCMESKIENIYETGLVCYYIASKLFSNWQDMSYLLKLAEDEVILASLSLLEKDIIKTLDGNLLIPTLFSYFQRFRNIWPTMDELLGYYLDVNLYSSACFHGKF